MIIAVEKSAGQNSAYRHLNMKGAFGNGGALRFFTADWLFSSTVRYCSFVTFSAAGSGSTGLSLNANRN
jgi:hypothetical protein